MAIVKVNDIRGRAKKPSLKQIGAKFHTGQRMREKGRIDKNNKFAAKNEEPKDVRIISNEFLSVRNIEEGMTLFGVVTDVDPTRLKVCSPGRTIGFVSASSISASYIELMRKYVANREDGEGFQPLPSLFQRGQIVCAKVLAKTSRDRRSFQINLSLKPSDIQSAFNHQHLKKHQMLFGAIEQVQDDGYVIETGINNLQAFLPYENSQEGLSVGEVICIKVTKLTRRQSATAAVCTSIENASRKIKKLEDTKLDYILPTTIVKFTVSKILPDGLEGTIMNGTITAHVSEHQLLKPFDVPSDYNVNSTVDATVLCVMPLEKRVHLSLRTSHSDYEQQLTRGDIVENACVHHIGTSGIIVDLNGKGKGLIPLGEVKSRYLGNYDQNQMFEKYKKNTKLQVRILGFNIIERSYACTDNPSKNNDKNCSIANLKAGEFVTGIVEAKVSSDYLLKVGNVRGYLSKLFMALPSRHLLKGSTVRCRIVSCKDDLVYVTNRKEYMSETALIPTDISTIKPNEIFVGTVVKTTARFCTVRFFANIVGILYLNDKVRLYEGATRYFRIISRDAYKIVVKLENLSLKAGEIRKAKVNNITEDGLEILISGEKGQKIKGFVPVNMLSDYQDIVVSCLKTHKLGDAINVTDVFKNIYSVRDVREYQENRVPLWADVAPGDILKAYVKRGCGEMIKVVVPFQNFTKLVTIPMDMFVEPTMAEASVVLDPDQVIYVKVLGKEDASITLTLSAKMSDVWDGDLKTTGEIFARYLDEIKKIKKKFKAASKPIGSYTVGAEVAGRMQSFSGTEKQWTVELPDNVRGLLKGSKKSAAVGEQVNCTIVWIDYSKEVVYLSSERIVCDSICKGLRLKNKSQDTNLIHAKVILKANEFVICAVTEEGKHPIVIVPSKLHFNDFENTPIVSLNEGDLVKVAFIHDIYPIAVPKSTWKACKKTLKHKAQTNVQYDEVLAKQSNVLNTVPDGKNVLKRKYVVAPEERNEEETLDKKTKKSVQINLVNFAEDDDERNSDDEKDEECASSVGVSDAETDDKNMIEDELISDNETSENEDDGESLQNSDSDKSDKESENSLTHEEINAALVREKLIDRKIRLENSPRDVQPLLPGANNFWSTDLNALHESVNSQKEKSSDEDSEKEEKTNSKKKKQTATEKFKAAREEEARLRQIEENYANPNRQPETVDEFDRLVLAKPHDSMQWINYMVFHLQAAEVDKARTVARRALKSVSFREETEIINIWVALLNLELRYGTNETFTEVLKESTLCNDAFKIYTRCLQILSDSQKIQELNNLIPTVTKKFKDKPDIWKYAASAYFEIGLADKAKALLHKALVALPEREHINTIVTFANLHHKYGDQDTAHTLLDQIVTSYPKRVDVWTQYVDMLVKDNEIESARRVLERAVAQKIPLKKMRTLFKKYLDFEEKHGNDESVQNVKQIAANYVKNEISS